MENMKKEELQQMLKDQPYSVLEIAKLGDAELLDNCFDILIQQLRNKINNISVTEFINADSSFRELEFISKVYAEVNNILGLKQLCSEIQKSNIEQKYGKTINLLDSQKERTVSLENLSKFQAEQKLAKTLIDSLLGDISFKSQEKFYTRNLLDPKQPE